VTDRRAAARNPLACHAPGFQEELRRLGYLEESVGLHLELLSDLGEWLAEHGVDVGELTEAQMRQYVEVRRARGEKRLV